MLRKIILLFVVSLFVLIIGCGYEISGDNATGEAIVCNKPYIQVGQDCCLDKDDNTICDKDEVEADEMEEGNVIDIPDEEKKTEEVIREEVVKEEPEKLEQELIVIMKAGDSVVFNGDTIELESIDLTSGIFEFVVDVEGVTRSLYSTKKMEIVNNVKITALKVNPLENSVEMKFGLFELGPNEYYIDTKKDVVVNGRTIKLRDVNKDEYVLLDIGGVLKRSIREGNSEVVNFLNVTNVNAFHRGSLNERYAILEVKKV